MKYLCKFIFYLIGWKVIGTLPKDKKYILIVAPHTSNRDFLICLCARLIVAVKVNFLAKSQLFVFPLSYFFKALGGTPVDRSKKGNQVEKAVELYKTRDEFRLALAPEGTRGPVTRWKEGFYHIACQAKIPIVMIAPDYATREVRICEPFWPTGDIAKDFPQILDFYRTIKGYRPKEIPEYHSR